MVLLRVQPFLFFSEAPSVGDMVLLFGLRRGPSLLLAYNLF